MLYDHRRRGLHVCCLSGVSVSVRDGGRERVRVRAGDPPTAYAPQWLHRRVRNQFYADRTTANTQSAAGSSLTVRQFVRPPVTLPALDPPNPPQPTKHSPTDRHPRRLARALSLAVRRPCRRHRRLPLRHRRHSFVFRRRANLERTAENRAESLSVAGRTPQHSAVAVPSIRHLPP